jgi:hypothetical protein
MALYMLSVVEPDGPMPPPEFLQKVMQKVEVVRQQIKDSGAWVFSGGLQNPSTSTVVRYREGEWVTTDGPFAEGKEHIGGIMILKAPDLDAALGWARKMAEAITLPIEVRPFRWEEH